ncbi:class C sortase [Collinsella tanakaei]|uniref:class C sortase n=1 Tax=Collinsella tanakaei TaxID=626935 RepID=UPI0025A45979|nr:class C sortase [Collinsella tanakaei]MDM8246415.1 class C sortase [Collinsella tanakaei]
MKRVRDILPVLVILAGLLVLLYPTISNYLIEQNASRAVASYDQATVDLSAQEREQMLARAHAYNDALAASSGAPTASEGGEPAQAVEAYEDLLNLNGDGMMGYIIIPKMNVELPVYHGVEEKVLQVGVGHLSETSLPVGGESTHAALSGHRGLPSAKLFTDLDQMEEGDQFYIKILGETLAYEVHSIETVLPTETESLAIQPGEDLVTLITCTPYGINSHRLLVHAHRIPYVPEMEDEIDSVGGFINIPLPYLLLMIALAVLAVFFIVLKVRTNRKDKEAYSRGKHAR